MAKLIDLIVSGKSSFANDISAKNIHADNFIRNGSSNNYVLLGGGGHKALSDFSMSHSHPYLSYSSVYPTNTINLNDYFSTSTMYRVYYDYSGSSKIQNGPYESDAGAVINFPTYSGTQVYFNYYNNDVKVRTHYNGHITSWATFITSENIGSQSVNYSASAGNADAVDGYHASSLWRSDGGTWNPSANISLNASGNGQEWSFDIRRNGYTGCFWHVWDSQLSTMLKVNADNGKVSAPYGFVGNLSGTASSVTVNDSTSNSTYRMVWHSGNTLYSTDGIYCNPSSDVLNAKAYTLNGASSAGTNYITGTAGRIYFGGNFHIDSLGSNATYINYYTGNNVYLVSGSSQGNVGIGTNAPTRKLDVNGSGKIYGSLCVGSGVISRPSLGALGNTQLTIGNFVDRDRNTFSYGTAIWTESSGAGFIQQGRGDGNGSAYPLILQVLGGNVGIGTSSPSYKLHVAGDVYANGGWLRSSGSTGWYNESYGGGIYMNDSTYVRIYNGKYLYTTYQYYDVGNQDYTIDHVYASNDRYIRPMAFSTFTTKLLSQFGITTDTRRSKNSSNANIESVTGYVMKNKSFIDIWGFAPTATYRTTKDRPAPYGIGFTDGSDSGGIMPVGDSNALKEIRFYGANSGPTHFTFGRMNWESTSYDSDNSNRFSIYTDIDGTNGNMWTSGSVAIGTSSFDSKLRVYGGIIRIDNSSRYLYVGPQNSSHAHYETNADVSHWFNKRVDVNGAIWRYNTNYGISSDGYFYAKGVYANRDGASTYGGISLYSTSDPINEYGIAFRGTGNYGKIGRVQGDWATYFTMDSSHNRGWIFRSGGTNYASVSARGEAYFNSVGTDNYIAYPSGGFFSSDGSRSGYIIITIPANYRSCTMMRFNVEIYNYSTGTSTTYTIGGYNYDDGNWYNVFAYANRQGITGYGNLTVRFGHNGTNSIIWIGESNTSYSYPKVRITNVTLGHSTTDYNTWASGWSVTIATTAPTNVSQIITNPATNYYAESAGNADTVDGQHFNWNNNKNDHTYLWAASSNGQAYLVHRASMSVNYASSAGNADTTDGLHVHSGRNNEANKIVRTDGSGYIQCGYINSSSGNEGNNSSPARVWGTNGSDNYMRTYLTSALSVKYSTSAGNADTLDSFHSNRFTFVYNSSNYNNSSSLTLNQMAADGNSNSHVGMIYAGTDNPVSSSGNWVHVWSQTWARGTISSWCSQIALGVQQGTGMWYRTTSGALAGRVWTRVIDSANIGSQSVSYASSSPAAANYGVTGNTTKIKIKINSAASWMLSFVVTIYQGYKSSKVMVSGYNYGSNYWYEPEAVLLGDSNKATSIPVYFGYDSAWNLWVGFDGGSYTGVSISDVTNGYRQISPYKGLFTISNVSSLSTLQTTITATNSVNYAVSAGNADTVDSQHFNWNNNKNDHTYLWAASSNGQAYLVHRASMSVNYANSAGSASSATIASTVTVNSSDANSTYRMVWHSGNTLYSTAGIYCNPSTDTLYASAFYETSDIRFKKNVKQLFTSNNIPQIKEFDWKNTGKHSYGLIAQELESMGYSELVDTKDDGYKSVNYTAALCLIIGKLQLKIKELEDKIKSSSI